MSDVHQLMAEILTQKQASPDYTEWAAKWNDLSQHTRNNVLIYLQEFTEKQPITHVADIMIFLLGIGIEMGNGFNQWITEFPRLELSDRYKVYEGIDLIKWGMTPR